MQKHLLYISSFILTALLFIEGCSVSGRYSHKESRKTYKNNLVRILLSDEVNSASLVMESSAFLVRNDNRIAIIHKGSRLNLITAGNLIHLNFDGQKYISENFELIPDGDKKISIGRNSYTGNVNIKCDGNKIQIINTLSIDSYLKGVIPAEMPDNNDEENFEALKAFAICARTYALMKIDEHKPNFDLYSDTRDQVYSGLNSENAMADRAVQETKGMILTYEAKPAIVFYHASCGGHTEKASNVFNVPDLPYLRGVKDGDPPNCSIAPNFNWSEVYSEQVFIQRLISAGLLDKGHYSLVSVNVVSRFSSGRVNLMQVVVKSGSGEFNTIDIRGNNIRQVIRNSDNNNILRSTMFNIKINSVNDVIIDGKGNGHGVGLCQWGAINLSRKGKSYKQILQFYFPGTRIMRYYD